MPDGEHEAKGHFLSNGVYDFVKYTAQIVLPAAGTLYFALSQIWGLPNGEEIVGTILAIDAFLGVVLGLSSVSYNRSEARFDGTIDVEDMEDKKFFQLNLNTDPDDLDQKEEIIFKVNKIS